MSTQKYALQDMVEYLKAATGFIKDCIQELDQIYGETDFELDATPLDYLHRYWRQVSPDDRLKFLTDMLTPAERRAIALGLEEDADGAL